MRSVSDILMTLKKRTGNKPVFLFLDYDGTLVPITRSPGQARMTESTRSLLKDLVSLPRVRLAVISGRSLQDIKKQVSLKGIVYAGNHGLEIEAPGAKARCLVPPAGKKAIRLIYRDLKHALSGIPGILLEDKRDILSIHYRLAAKARVRKIRSIVKNIVRPFVLQKKLNLSAGKKVIEVLPPVSWNKGHAVSCLLRTAKTVWREKKIMPVYIGDDITDENAFRTIGKNGMTIRVGRSKNTSARYLLKSTRKVQSFLRMLYEWEKRP
jgi:alpha,alpha-trehalase